MSDTVFFHEDYYLQKELIPEQNYFKALTDIDNLPSVENAPYGFDNAIIRSEHLVKTSDLKIPLRVIQDILLPISINHFLKVNTGYGNHIEPQKNTIAFGFERLGIFVEFEKDIVTNIWLCQSPLFIHSKTCEKLLTALHTLGKSFHLLLIDWDQEVIVRISNLQSITNYLSTVFGFMIPEK